MLQYLDSIDRAALLFCNSHHSSVFDVVFWHISKNIVWIPLYISICYVLVRRFGVKTSLLVLASVAVSVSCADLISVHCFKNVFCRFRPTHNPAIEHLVHVVRDYRGGNYGFISSHAANTMAAAVCFGLVVSRRWFWLVMMFWAVLVGYSRIYLGVHYPFDVLTGYAVGALVAYAVYRLYCFISLKLHLLPHQNVV